MFGRRKKQKNDIFKMSSDADFLLHDNQSRADQIGLHPRLWAALGVLFVVLGITEGVLAGLVWHWLGLAVGFGLAKTGTTLVGIGVTGGRQAPLPPGASFGQHCRHACSAIVLWGSSKFQRLLYALRWALIGYGAFVALLIAIRIYSPDPAVTAFPSGCPLGNRLGCSRVADSAPQSARKLQPLRIPASLNATQAAVEAWIEDQSGTTILRSSQGFVHARVLTPMWGFADDIFVGLRCDKDADSVVVEAQGQLRLGQSDLGVNARRNRRFFEWMAANSGQLPQGKCEGGDGGEGGGDEKKRGAL